MSEFISTLHVSVLFMELKSPLHLTNFCESFFVLVNLVSRSFYMNKHRLTVFIFSVAV